MSGNDWVWLCGLVIAGMILAPTIIRRLAQYVFLHQKRRRLQDRFAARLARKN
ncbi:hypothetical protein [Belnapia sp. F-4-1]|uniref:hypothetical protein n=1 Tax=Belnapia sp. F-4-1 TaxID=1545443 RepID=UPI00136494CC|nr:hypothetical protein [Belnapia sp. F-4-1]